MRKQYSAEEVEQQAAAWGINIPLALKEQMMILGIGMAFFIIGSSDYDIHEFDAMQAAGREVLQDDRQQEMYLDNILILACMAGQRCWFLKTDEGENPPVYYYECRSETENEPEVRYVKQADSFSEHIAYYSPYYKTFINHGKIPKYR